MTSDFQKVFKKFLFYLFMFPYLMMTGPPLSSINAFKNTPPTICDTCHISRAHAHAHTQADPVPGVPGSPLQPLLQLRAQASWPTELLHHPAGVPQLVGGQQGLQGPQVALQGLGQGRHGLGGHGGEGATTRLQPERNLQGGRGRGRGGED